MDKSKYNLEDRLLEYAANLLRLAGKLPDTLAGRHVAAQVLRSGTSPLANHAEAESAESRNDFIHKMKICLKELSETKCWLRLICRAQLLKELQESDPFLIETEELIKIFVASIRTATHNKHPT